MVLGLGASRAKASEEIPRLVMEAYKQGIGLSLISPGKCNIMGEKSEVIESFGDHLPSLIPLTCFSAMGGSQKVRRM